MSTSFILRPYQIEDAERMCAMRRAQNVSEMRTGKTPTACGAARLTIERGLVDRWISISPKSLRENWCREWSRFGINDSAVGSIELLRGSDVRLCATHPNNLPSELCRPTGRIGKEGKAVIAGLGRYGVILDEAHLYLGHGMMSKRIRNLMRGAVFAWVLTGSPIRTGIEDAWTMAWLLGIELELYESWPAFCRLTGGGMGAFDRWELGPKTEAVIEKQRALRIRRTRAEVAPHLSPLEYAFQVVEGAPPSFTSRLLPVLRVGKLPRLEQYTEALLGQALRRVSAALRWAEERETDQRRLLVFSAFREPLRAFAGREGWAVVDGDGAEDWRGKRMTRDEVVRDHRSYRGIASTIGALGVGHTLDGIDEALFIDQRYVPADNRQAADRIIGENKRSLITIFVTDDRLDISLQETLACRTELLDQALA